MQNGGFVEVATRAQLVAGTVAYPYTRVLTDGSRGYGPKALGWCYRLLIAEDREGGP